MATEVEALLLRIEASATKLERDMAKARQTFDSGARAMERRAKEAGETMGAALSSALSRGAAYASAAIGAYVSAEKINDAAQAYLRIGNQLKVAGLEGQKLNRTFEQLYVIAQANSAPLETLATLYAKVAQAKDALKANDPQIIAFTTAVAQAIKITGRSAEESAGALLQMGQALQTGTVRAEEYNSMQEGLYPILQAAAAGLKEAGGEVNKLTQLVKGGEVSSAAFFNAILAGAPILGQRLSGATKTSAQAWTEFENALIKVAGQLNATYGFAEATAKKLEAFTEIVLKIPQAIEEALKYFEQFRKGFVELGDAIQQFTGIPFPDFAAAFGPAGKKTPNFEGIAKDALTAKMRVQEAFDVIGNAPKIDMGARAEAINARVGSAFDLFKPKVDTKGIKPVSIKDYPTAPDGQDQEDEFQKAIRRAQERMAILKAETETVGKSTYEIERATKAQELKNAAEQTEIGMTPQRQAEIDKVAAAYAAQTEALEKAKKAHQQFVDQQKFTGELISGFFSDIVSGGKNAEEALMNLKKKLIDAALQAALLGQGPLANLFGMAAPTNGVGGLFKFGGSTSAASSLLAGGLYDGGGYTGPGAKDALAGFVHKGEVVWSQADVRAAGGVAVVEALRRGLSLPGYAAGGVVGRPALAVPNLRAARAGGGVSFGDFVFNAPGADAAGLAQLRAEVKAMQKSLPKQIAAVQRTQQIRKVAA